MSKELSDKMVKRIRQEVKDGKTKLDVSREYGISYYRVKKHTKDLLRGHYKYTPDFVEKIRKMTRKLENKTEVARRLDIPYQQVRMFTQDIRIRNYVLGEQTMALLQEIISKGYAYLSGWKSLRIRTLKKYFPSIQVAKCRGASIAFLEEHKDEAAREMLKHINKRVWDYRELRAVTKLFDTDLSRKEKHQLAGFTNQTEEITKQHTLDEFS